MVEREWFWLKQAKDAIGLTGDQNFSRQRYPYYIDEAAFDGLEDGTAFYKHRGVAAYDDIIFEPTFMIGDYLEPLFHYLEPDMRFKLVQLIDAVQKEKAPAPSYWVPYLPCTEALHKSSEIIMGKAKKIVLQREAIGPYQRIIHIHLPADDIWLLSLEAAECLLRRSPIGIGLEQVACI